MSTSSLTVHYVVTCAYNDLHSDCCILLVHCRCFKFDSVRLARSGFTGSIEAISRTVIAEDSLRMLESERSVAIDRAPVL